MPAAARQVKPSRNTWMNCLRIPFTDLFRYSRHARKKAVIAKQARFSLWYDRGGTPGDIKRFDTYYRKIRYLFNKLEKGDYLRKVEGTHGGGLGEDRS